MVLTAQLARLRWIATALLVIAGLLAPAADDTRAATPACAAAAVLTAVAPAPVPADSQITPIPGTAHVRPGFGAPRRSRDRSPVPEAALPVPARSFDASPRSLDHASPIEASLPRPSRHLPLRV